MIPLSIKIGQMEADDRRSTQDPIFRSPLRYVVRGIQPLNDRLVVKFQQVDHSNEKSKENLTGICFINELMPYGANLSQITCEI